MVTRGRMDRFVSNFTNRIDAKGRISIPAAFRSTLARGDFEGLFLHPSLDHPALDCGGQALLSEIDALLGRLAPYSAERDGLSTALLGVSEILKVDSEGRVVLTETLKSYAGLTDEATFVGQGSKFQIWEPARFRAHLSASRESLRAFRTSLAGPAA